MDVDFAKTLSDYNQQLKQVDEFLSSDPSNPQFLSLRKDLIQAISLTTELLIVDTSRSQVTDNHQTSENSASKENDDEYDVDDSGSEDEVDENYAFAKASTAATLPAKYGAIAVGEVICVSGGDRPYAGVVVELKLEAAECVIKYFESDSEVVLPLISISRVDPGYFKPSDVTIGMKCLCKYSADQVYYEAEVISKSKYGYVVKYSEYGNAEDVPLEYLKPLSVKKGVKEKKAMDGSLELIKVPEKLKILPTDNEEVSE
jgi:hypothetical protein